MRIILDELKITVSSIGLLVKRYNTVPFQGIIHRFEPGTGHHYAPLAQRLERVPYKRAICVRFTEGVPLCSLSSVGRAADF